jgi:serine/threonine protein kinase
MRPTELGTQAAPEASHALASGAGLSARRISHYALLEPLGQGGMGGMGGMGEVYTGFDETLKRRVALKAILAEHRLSAHARIRFLREAQILSQLDHPQICRIFDYVEGPDADYLVLEFIEGRSLRASIRKGLDPSQSVRRCRRPIVWGRSASRNTRRRRGIGSHRTPTPTRCATLPGFWHCSSI